MKASLNIRKTLVAASLLFPAIFTISCNNSKNESESTTNTNNKYSAPGEREKPTVNVNLADLEKEYNANAAALEQKYKGSYVILDCTVQNIETVQFNINCSDDCMFGHVCYMENSSDLAKLSKGQKIRMKCFINGNLTLNFYKCTIL